MITPKTKFEIEELIRNSVEENHQLEYKSADALFQKSTNKDFKNELIKDITGMANASGGVIIYGIKEFDEKSKKYLPEKITPIDRAKISKEQLEHLIRGNISPQIDSLLIHPIPLDNANEVIYVVEVPKGVTAHQNRIDKKYYKRRNFEVDSMYDDEIRDVMNRQTFPVLDLEFSFEARQDNNSSILSGPIKHATYLTVRIKNNGSILAKYVNFQFEVNRNLIAFGTEEHLLLEHDDHKEGGFLTYYGDNTTRDILNYEYSAAGSKPKYGPSRYEPILPNRFSKIKRIKIKENDNPYYINQFKDSEINWKIFADNAPVRNGSIKIGEIKK